MTDRGRYQEIEAFDMQPEMNELESVSVRPLVWLYDCNIILLLGADRTILPQVPNRLNTVGLGTAQDYDDGSKYHYKVGCSHGRETHLRSNSWYYRLNQYSRSLRRIHRQIMDNRASRSPLSS